MAPRIKKEEKQVIIEIPDEFKILKMDIMDYVFSKAQADYYFGLLFGLHFKRSQRRTEDLFSKGALIKIHSDKDNKPTLYPAPPTFMFFVDEIDFKIVKKHKKAIEKLEDLYYKRFCTGKDSILRNRHLFVTAKGHFFNGFRFFLIKKYLKDKAKITFMKLDDDTYEHIKLSLGLDKLNKITVLMPDRNNINMMKDFKEIKVISRNLLGMERITIINETFLMNFFRLRDLRGKMVMTGYVSSDKNDIDKAKEKFKELYGLSSNN